MTYQRVMWFVADWLFVFASAVAALFFTFLWGRLAWERDDWSYLRNLGFPWFSFTAFLAMTMWRRHRRAGHPS